MDNGHGGIRLIKVNPVNFDELIDLKVNKSQNMDWQLSMRHLSSGFIPVEIASGRSKKQL